MDIINDIAREFDKKGNDRYVKIPDREEAIQYAIEHSRPSDIVLLAGKGHESYQLIDRRKYPFSEKKLLSKYAHLIRTEAAVK